MKAGTICCNKLHKEEHDKRGSAESLDAYILYAKLITFEGGVFWGKIYTLRYAHVTVKLAEWGRQY